MRTKLALLLCVTSSMIASVGARAATITYTGRHSVGANQVGITVVTDGTIGSIDRTNILSWSFVLNDGTTSADFYGTYDPSNRATTGNSTLIASGLLSASASSLVLPYRPNAGNNEFGFYVAGFSSYYGAGNGSIISISPAEVFRLNGGAVTSEPLSTDFTIGTVAQAGAVPEPAAWATMIGGLGVVGGAMRRRKARVRTRRHLRLSRAS